MNHICDYRTADYPGCDTDRSTVTVMMMVVMVVHYRSGSSVAATCWTAMAVMSGVSSASRHASNENYRDFVLVHNAPLLSWFIRLPTVGRRRVEV